MIKLLELLASKYISEKASTSLWDAASWHASKKFKQAVDEHNKSNKPPKVKLAPYLHVLNS